MISAARRYSSRVFGPYSAIISSAACRASPRSPPAPVINSGISMSSIALTMVRGMTNGLSDMKDILRTAGDDGVLALQLHSSFQMRALCGGLLGAPPQRPGDDQRRLNTPLRQTHSDAAHFLHRPAMRRASCIDQRTNGLDLPA